jgi:hypothetical protein
MKPKAIQVLVYQGVKFMTIGLALALLSTVFACCLLAYRITATERGWPMGSVYLSEVPIFLALMCIVVAMVRVIFGAANGHFSWWMLLLILPAWFIGAPVALNLLKEKTGPAALIGAPLTAIAALFVR